MVALTVALAAAGCSGPRSNYTPTTPGLVSVVSTTWTGPAYRKDGRFYAPNDLPEALADQPAAAARARRSQRWARHGLLLWLPGALCFGATLAYQVEELEPPDRHPFDFGEPTTYLAMGCAAVAFVGQWMWLEAQTDRWDAVAMYNDAVLAGRLPPVIAPAPRLPAPAPAAPPAPAP